MIIDSHIHLDSFDKLQIPNDILPIPTGHSHESNKKTVKIAEKYSLPYVLGIAPQTALIEGVTNLENWIKFIKINSPKAIGEIGLDFHWAKGKEDIEKEYFLFYRMLDLAEEMSLPLVIHSRNAEKDVFETLKKYRVKKFLMHCYSGNEKLAQEIVAFGGLISIPPVCSKNRKEVIKKIPLEYLVVESDAPYLSREIDGVKKAIEYIAEIKCLVCSKVIEQTEKNARMFFSI